MTEKLLVPDIGDFENVEVIELLVKKGQKIKKNDPVDHAALSVVGTEKK